jgi:hypothetical protein
MIASSEYLSSRQSAKDCCFYSLSLPEATGEITNALIFNLWQFSCPRRFSSLEDLIGKGDLMIILAG